MTSNERQQLKNMLQGAGLKVSLVRMKILEVLQRSEQGLRSRDLHGYLLLADEQISVLSVRQVLSRLVCCGLVVRDDDGLYRLRSPHAQAVPVALAG
ncbi:Fur family transcriptional regulator [Pseudomonas sp. Gutcm_11s]|uniref:Fur family transcriptional regulator n=1 Tax=Pseudomonas sp. Gutcm_11s TaxID=3026088 RepID=UPI002361AA5B|nr:Fur family transcriptional regulator [Pseudomonas sp. Gutcm_11s]MDD0841982.1 Fur family transcriptional regulator [Pseudomonas sp. Gutcm_11s]